MGAYLQGSFAVGDYTPYSDCDFMIVIREDLSKEAVAGLGKLHIDVHALTLPHWPKNLEGSYAPAPVLRRWSADPRDPPGEARTEDWGDPGMSGSPPLAYPFWYVDRGSTDLVRSEHDNSRVVRRILRERGIVLTGPDPKTLIDPVPDDALRAEVKRVLDLAAASELKMTHRAGQAFWVGLACRVLHTLETGEIASKPASMTWACAALEPHWHGLIERAQALGKGDDAQTAAPVDRAEASATRAFVAYCRNQANVR